MSKYDEYYPYIGYSRCKTMRGAIRRNNIHAFKFYIDESMKYNIKDDNNVKKLNYIDSDIICITTATAYRNNFEFLKYAFNKGHKLGKEIPYYAVKYANYDMLKFYVDNTSQFLCYKVLLKAIEYCNVDYNLNKSYRIIDYITNLEKCSNKFRYKYNDEYTKKTIIEEKYDCFYYLLKLGYCLPFDLCKLAVKNCNIELFKLAINNCLKCSRKAINTAIQQSYQFNSINNYFISYGKIGNNELISHPRHDIIKYLYEIKHPLVKYKYVKHLRPIVLFKNITSLFIIVLLKIHISRFLKKYYQPGGKGYLSTLFHFKTKFNH